MPQYIVRRFVSDIVRRSTAAAKRADALEADADHAEPGPYQEIADAFSAPHQDASDNSSNACGFERALERRRRAFPPVPKLLDGVAEAHLIALRTGPPPKRLAHRSLRPPGRQPGRGRRVGDRR